MENPSTLQESDDFLYAGDECECEDPTRYKQFGLHPIILGDVLPKPLTCVSDVNKEPRYRVMLKLGFGAFATVWLARDLVDKRYVAVKVGHGSDNPLPDRECEILSQIRQTGPGKHGYERVIELLDAFVVEGPNGFHQCLVTEVVSPISDPDTREHCSYDILQQIVEGFAFLHGEGIVHGDPHIGNFGIALPQLQQFEEDDIIDFFDIPEIVPVIHWDPKLPVNSFPPYLVQSVSMRYFLETRKAFPAGSLVTVKILDFGRAHRIDKDPDLLGAVPMMIRPPEFILHELCDNRIGSTWSEAADIWALGCTSLFRPGVLMKIFFSRQFNTVDLPQKRGRKFGSREIGNMTIVGILCYLLFELRSRDTDYLAPALYDRDKVWGVPRNEEVLRLVNLLKRMVITKPDERTSMTVLLTDPFMVERRKKKESIDCMLRPVSKVFGQSSDCAVA
ncbi:related to dis1-suppressing protein kinase dsk1 [Claviceps purpurea 20.1]|uniref:non-specific serine/threonine protein kinase n=1 Tax=Claviceps purpurea (strain 20.1) TaxID=1111077 RepID=M1VXZ9_CLAP2|nr:related to dis1-suppressing protein kinase dsk1 [Claviceps purpurea 20.1]